MSLNPEAPIVETPSTSDGELKAWLETLSAEPEWEALLAPLAHERGQAGYGHTLVEICQQPLTWPETARRVAEARERLWELVADARYIVLTGSGSSQYVGECCHPALQAATKKPVVTLGGGWILTEGLRGIPWLPSLVISLARSGDSPESTAAVGLMLKAGPCVQNLVITCNRAGSLATHFTGHPQVTVLTLDDRTNDRSLVMTSSFTNMVVALDGLSRLVLPDEYRQRVARMASAAQHVLLYHTGTLAKVSRDSYRKVVYLGSGCRLGAAKESALKMLEMTSGRVMTMAETPLGLRHGPLCMVDRDTLVVVFLASDPVVRAYEADVLAEMDRKELGARRVIFGESVPASLVRDCDTVIEVPGLKELGGAASAVLDVLGGQLLAFFRCLAEGFQPDKPGGGVIGRVVDKFTIHQEAEESGSELL